MYVDGNNYGSSRIIALGNYMGDEFWFVDYINGTMEMEVIEQLAARAV